MFHTTAVQSYCFFLTYARILAFFFTDSGFFVFPDNVKKGDALIVFSKKSVLNVAAELQRNKIRCSVIYGALPYEVRENEVDKFNSGETDVVVSTDAIGMGMNPPDNTTPPTAPTTPTES